MSVHYSGSGRPVTEAELVQVEQRLGRAIPATYRAFLLQHNGGRPDQNGFVIYDENRIPADDGSINYFLGIRPGEVDNLEEYIEIYDGRIPSHFFPIAADAGGNLLCISTASDDQGTVYFWDHEGEDDPPSYDNVHFVAASFEELLSSLRESY